MLKGYICEEKWHLQLQDKVLEFNSFFSGMVF